MTRSAILPSLRDPQPGCYWIDRLARGDEPVTELHGLPSDLSGWLAFVGLACLVRTSGALIGYRAAGQRGQWYSDWDPVVTLPADDLAQQIRVAVSVGAESRADHPLRWYAGQQTAEKVLRRVEKILAERDIADLLTSPAPLELDCPTFRWSPDSVIQPAYQAGGRGSAGRPLVEWLGWHGVLALRWDPWGWNPSDGQFVRWPVHPVEPVRRWLRRTICRSPRPSLTRWGSRVVKSDRYRRACSPAVPAPGHSVELRW